MFERQKQFIRNFENDAFTELRNAINNNSDILADYVTNKQLFDKGEDGRGKRLQGYARTTIRLKISKGQPADRTTLRDKNKFHPTIEIRAYEKEYQITSNVTYDLYIIKRYGKDVLRVQDANFKQFLDTFFIPNLRANVNNQLTK